MVHVTLHCFNVPQCVARKREHNQFRAKIEHNWNETHIEKEYLETGISVDGYEDDARSVLLFNVSRC